MHMEPIDGARWPSGIEDRSGDWVVPGVYCCIMFYFCMRNNSRYILDGASQSSYFEIAAKG